MNKNTKIMILCAFLSVIVLSSCSGNGEKTNKDESTRVPETASVTISPIPEIPEGGVPEISGGDVIYTDENVIVQVDPSGTSYVNGKPMPSDDVSNIIDRVTTTTGNTPPAVVDPSSPSVPETTKVTKGTTVTEPKAPVVPEETTRPSGTINGDEDIFFLGKYVNSNNTDLKITNITVFNNSKPGINGVDSFKPGDSMIINLWCNTEARFDSTVYVVPAEAEHKNSYASADCLTSYDMYLSFEAGEGQLAMEITLPSKIVPGVYELRFICGSEEGYIPFHMG